MELAARYSDSFMPSNVHHAHIESKWECAPEGILSESGFVHAMHMAETLGKTFLREWREDKGITLVEAAEYAGLKHGQLSRIERGLAPYNQRLLESLAVLYDCGVEQLIKFPPHDRDNIWSFWQSASANERFKIVQIAKTIVEANPSDSAEQTAAAK
jgi:transcriptional regulator with XRE-family HTH domain